MSVKKVMVDGREYPVAPIDPELHDYPSPAYPVAVTPDVARSWLRYNWRNRAQRAKGLSDYSTDMSEGRFDLNGSTITFSRPLGEGEDADVPCGKPVLVDGQHRLQSCVASGKAFVTYVAYGLDPLARRTVDGGIKRKFQDVLQMDGEINSAELAAITTRCYAWSIGDRHLLLKGGGITKAALENFLKEHPELRRSAFIACQVHSELINSSLRKSVVGTAHWLLMQADNSYAPEFFARLGDGAEMSKDHQIMVLRRRLLKDRRDMDSPQGSKGRFRVPDWQQLVYLLRTWNAIKEDRLDFQLVARTDHQRMPAILSSGKVSKASVALLRELDEDNLAA